MNEPERTASFGPPLEPVGGSFRDPLARVFDDGSRVLRALTAEGAADFDVVEATPFYRRALRDGSLIGTARAGGPQAAQLRSEGWAAVLEHERVPVISYPYEWSFSMRRDAALLHLQLVADALAAGLSCKDGSAYNVQFVAARPVFIDIGSLAGPSAHTWPGYRQFCSQFLAPLLIESYLGISPNPLLRGSIEGIDPETASRLLRGVATIRPGVMSHVKAQALIARRLGSRPDPAAPGASASDRDVNIALVKRLLKLVAGLKAPAAQGTWDDYTPRHHYSRDALVTKDEFVRCALDAARPASVLDLGCNDGRYSELACRHGRQVVATDAASTVIDGLYRRATARSILPLVQDLADPSPAQGWGHAERVTLDARFQPDLALALALIHHLVIGRNVPVGGFLDQLAATAPRIVLEVPHHDDEMVVQLRARKAGAVPEYHEQQIDREVRSRFRVVEQLELPGRTRTLYDLRAVAPARRPG